MKWKHRKNDSRATLEFPLPECKFDLDIATHAIDMYCLLIDIDNHCRGKLKWDDSISEDTEKVLEEIRTMIHEDKGNPWRFE